MRKLLLIAGLVLPALSGAQTLKCDTQDVAQLNTMSQKNLMEAYCEANATITAATSGNMLTEQRAADLQRTCLEEKKKISDVLKHQFRAEPKSCSPLIENSKK